MPIMLLDLFCGAGGAAMGYHRAGFTVVGVDNRPQPDYPFDFVCADASRYPLDWIQGFDAIHASPPCQKYSTLGQRQSAETVAGYVDLVAQTRELLQATGVPWVIENVVGAPLVEPILCCGAAFDLGAVCDDGRRRPLRRHRLFESNVSMLSPGCACGFQEPVGVYGEGGAQRKTASSTAGLNRGYMGTLRECREAMGIDWMRKRELAQAIPPAYTEFIAHSLIDQLTVNAARIVNG